MLGADLLDVLLLQGFDTTALGSTYLDFRDLHVGPTAKQLEEFDVVINAAAYTDVVGAETNEILANQVNGHAPGIIAQSCKSVGNRFIHISTDYVFDGTATEPYATDSKIRPLNAYGRSKALGEKLVTEAGANATIVRTSWLYGARGKCFPKTIAAKLGKREIVTVVSDQIGQPTWTRDLAEQILQYSKAERFPEILHIASSGQASWFDFACEISTSIGLNCAQFVEPVKCEEFASSIKRPNYSVLDLSESPLEPIADWKSRWEAAESEMFAALRNEIP
jgi:dTDP-4-dehydrorhamnose reductase